VVNRIHLVSISLHFLSVKLWLHVFGRIHLRIRVKALGEGRCGPLTFVKCFVYLAEICLDHLAYKSLFAFVGAVLALPNNTAVSPKECGRALLRRRPLQVWSLAESHGGDRLFSPFPVTATVD
jgi:hypothetical protein